MLVYKIYWCIYAITTVAIASLKITWYGLKFHLFSYNMCVSMPWMTAMQSTPHYMEWYLVKVQ